MYVINLIIKIISKISAVVSSLYRYREIFEVTGVFATRKFSTAKNFHKYAILVAARNEETVIGNLIDCRFVNDVLQN